MKIDHYPKKTLLQLHNYKYLFKSDQVVYLTVFQKEESYITTLISQKRE